MDEAEIYLRALIKGKQEKEESDDILHHIFTKFIEHFWMALDTRNYSRLVDSTLQIANKVEDLKDETPNGRMVMETIQKLFANLGASQDLISLDDNEMFNLFAAVVNSLGQRVKIHLPHFCFIINCRMNDKSAKVRQQAVDLISRIVVIKHCQEEQLLDPLGFMLCECLGEENPQVLGSILASLRVIINVISINKNTPFINDSLTRRLIPMLKNSHEIVQENCIDLVGSIAVRGAEFVTDREPWIRICFELLEMLNAHKKGIRRATANTYGCIAKAIGPHDVLAILLNNLKVQKYRNLIWFRTAAAIAIVTQNCSPFTVTVMPALMNEYRVPELQVQIGVLKSLSFLFEYIGEKGEDDTYVVTPLLEDGIMKRYLVHRQLQLLQLSRS